MPAIPHARLKVKRLTFQQWEVGGEFRMTMEYGGHSIRVLLTGELVDGWVQPNGGWLTVWVEAEQDEWAAIRKIVVDIRRVIRFEQTANNSINGWPSWSVSAERKS